MLGIIALLIIAVSLSFVFGWVDVLYTKTVGKGKQNAERVVFEESQSYVEGKRQEALKLYKEHLQAEDEEAKQAIREIALHTFANFDENKLKGKVKDFIHSCKYE